MLKYIQSFIGGSVRDSVDNTDILWIADDQAVIQKIL